MQLALQQARLCGNDTSPNPRVGCVIVKEGVLLGAGHTQPPGGNHAEIEALRAAQAQQQDVRGATAYVTLEPCSHFGRTPPCADALVKAGLARVVAAIGDPNPQVAGQGMAKLAQAGIAVQLGMLQEAARDINLGFFKRMQTGLPWVRMKVAASLDGKTALKNGQSQWITGAEARQDGHAWRARADVILTGIGTVQADDPQLNVRGIAVKRQPRRLIVDSKLDISLQAKIVQDGTAMIAFAQRNLEKEAQLQALGLELLYLPNSSGKVDLPALLRELGQRNVNEVHVEAGLKLHASLLREGCVDELLLYFAPKILGDAQTMFALPALQALADLPAQQQCKFHAVEQIGAD
ncbi:MAG: bifunctional diaminohydroxyphosphoribosylaminopyrimidine deaminase/5-amino-6-(5-phosphoribosylamino)uracil reductase RibD, partial [Burkholderiales bacterium]|nr:bifunctional diaminohydroxyphosphoribosylaminopyrimidine deaminase/5-amino-6-(5-phosphoribosylamino)uracil reductase RibD [Burkholderiales bacterium]